MNQSKIHWSTIKDFRKPVCGTKAWHVCLMGHFCRLEDITCKTCRKKAEKSKLNFIRKE